MSKVSNPKKGYRQNWVVWWKKKTEKESCADLYKDTIIISVKKGTDIENNATIKDQEKETQKGRKKGERNWKTRRDKKRQHVDRGGTKGGSKEAKKTFWKEKCWKDFSWVGKVKRLKKKGSYKLSKHNF